MEQFKKLKEFLENILNGDNKKKIVQNSVIVIIIGIIIIIAGSTFFGGGSKSEGKSQTGNVNNSQEVMKTVYNNEKEELEKELENILSQMQGAGKVSVMITFESGKESVPATDVKKSDNNTREKDNTGGTREINQSTYESSIAYEEGQGGGKKPIILKEMQPKVKGVIIISDGADDPQVKENLCNAAKVLLDVPVYKVQVFPRNR